MPSHDRFRELAALAAIGQLGGPDNDELAIHLRTCAECREAYAEYARFLRQDLPQANPARFRASVIFQRSQEVELRERFIARARAHGARFSPDAERSSSLRTPPTRLRFHPRWALVGIALALAVTAAVSVEMLHRRAPLMAGHTAVAAVPEPTQYDNLTEKQLQRARHEISDLTRQLAQLSEKYDRVGDIEHDRDRELAQTKRRLEELAAQLAQAQTDNQTLVASHQRDQAEAVGLQKQIQTLQASNADTIATMIQLQDRIRSLNASMKQDSDRLDMEQQMASVSSDIRALMGARNLHIIDVHDVDGSGKSAKSFGRVFYAEGHALVFYAFDLPSSGKLTRTKYYFKAWGQNEESAESVRNLGTFTVDDRDQRRWVLKVNNSALLKGIDSVFVTAETMGDVAEPFGKRLLYAYFAGNPNHP